MFPQKGDFWITVVVSIVGLQIHKGKKVEALSQMYTEAWGSSGFCGQVISCMTFFVKWFSFHRDLF